MTVGGMGFIPERLLMMMMMMMYTLVRVLRPSMSRCIRIGHIRVSGTAVSIEQGVVRHEWGVLNTASAASSHREGSMVTQVAVQSRGPRNTHRDTVR